ncbi:MAG: DNA translocase FtsK [Treponema sp.]|nr:DNA translocase FtsK [Treponema sp.]
MQFFRDFEHKYSTDSYFKFRTISVLLAVFFGLSSVFIIFSIFSTLFQLGFFPVVPGIFLVRSFGLLSLLVPGYFAYAAFILADPRWKPDRIFFLNGLILPFLTLAVGFVFIRDFESRSLQNAFLNFTGKTGFSLFIVTITALEVLLIQLLRNTIFSAEKKNTKHRASLLPSPDVPIEEEENDIQENQQENQDDSFQDELHLEKPLFKRPSPTVSFLGVISDSGIVNDDIEVEELKAEHVSLDDVSDLDELITVEYEEQYEEQNQVDIDEEDDDVIRMLDEAEAAAAAHGEQIRKKVSSAGSFKYKKYKIPVDILNEYPDGEYWIIDQATKDAAIALKQTLEEFKIQAEVTGIRKGPVITMFEILPAPGVKLSRIVGLQDNIALRLAASSVRIVAPIPGKHAVGIEVPNAKRNIVSFREIIEGELVRSDGKMGIPIVMGKDITGEAQTVDLVQMPHLLIAGATGSGKSVCVNSIILSILYQLHPNECRLLLIDPKIVELKLYNDIPHLLTPVITESKKAFQALQYCIYEMERRYACLDKMGVRDIRSYNRRVKEKNIMQEQLPYIVVIIDEFADLMTTTGKELESTVARLAAMSRAVGIHLVLATQRPSIDVITGLIKANIPSRIAFMVASKTDSRIIIDMVGAEKLLGKGDMLYAGVVDPFPIRMQGAFISEEEVEAVVEHVKTFGEPDYIDDEIFFEDEEEDSSMSLFSDGGDPLYEKALEIVMQQGKASASFIQRRLKIGFNRAARLVDEMEHHGVVGPAHGSKPRELLRGSAFSHI